MSGDGSAAAVAGSGDLVHRLVRLVRLLRARGVPLGPAETAAALRALDLLDLGDRHEVYLGLRAVLVPGVEHYAHFADLFAALFTPDSPAAADDQSAAQRAAPGRAETKRATPAAQLQQWLADAEAADADDDPHQWRVSSDLHSLSTRDFAHLDAAELDRVAELAARIARRLALCLGRRLARSKRRRRIDPRRTLRRALRYGGDPIELAYKQRKIRRTRLVVLCDVSGSMDLYSRFLLQFVFALQSRLLQIEVFLFSTVLTRVTAALDHRSWQEAMDAVGRLPAGWSGGTRIGANLAEFVRMYGRTLLDRRSVVVILSDGLDTGPPAELAAAMRSLQAAAGRVVWLNPLMGHPHYEPLARGMQAALPYVDVLASAHSLQSLQRLDKHLRGGS